MAELKKVDLFGNEEVFMAGKPNRKPNLFTNYDAFVDKFEAKKTTDDCYTPPLVYDAVVRYVRRNVDLTSKKIVRPFFPGNDFEAVEYPADAVVIDNPPFSIIGKIVKFYISKDVPFFLFAPHLTLFSSDLNCAFIVAYANVVYDNGAEVKTSFLSNMFENSVIGAADLHAEIKELHKKANPLPKYRYPNNVLTVSRVAKLVESGISVTIEGKHLAHCRGLQSQKKHGKSMFGSGFLISDAAAEMLHEKEREREREREWELSPKELEIIKSLGNATGASVRVCRPK